MAWTDIFNLLSPPDSGEEPKLGASRIREFKRAVAERLNVDHIFAVADDKVDGTDTGKHRQTTLVAVDGEGNNVGEIVLRAVQVGENIELFAVQNGTEVQITQEGQIAAAPATQVDFARASSLVWLHNSQRSFIDLPNMELNLNYSSAGKLDLHFNAGFHAHRRNGGCRVRLRVNGSTRQSVEQRTAHSDNRAFHLTLSHVEPITAETGYNIKVQWRYTGEGWDNHRVGQSYDSRNWGRILIAKFFPEG